MKRLYIITGANGHLASTIIRYLSRENCLVRGLLLPKESHEDTGSITYFKGDVTDPVSMEDIFSGMDIAMIFDKFAQGVKKNGIKYIESTRELEDNSSVQNLWRYFERNLTKRARIYKKDLKA